MPTTEPPIKRRRENQHTSELTLFDPPAVRESVTSVAAAKRLRRSKVNADRILILQYLSARREQFKNGNLKHDGATDQMIQEDNSLTGDNERPRRRELVQAGFVIDSGTKIQTSNQCWAIAWCITDTGLAELRRVWRHDV